MQVTDNTFTARDGMNGERGRGGDAARNPAQPAERPPRRVAVVGYGNIGRHALEALQEAPDLEIAGVVRRNPAAREDIDPNIPVVGDVGALDGVDGALLCVPSRRVAETAEPLLTAGISTVDSFDIHGQPLVDLRSGLHRVAQRHDAVAVVAAGWDPGTDSIVRALLEAMAPKGITHTNFGPGVSMGHSTVVRALDGVADAISLTVPQGTGVHRRLVYVQLEEGASEQAVREAILTDDYFKHDDTRVAFVDDVEALTDVGHGVRIERKGVAGRTHNQQFTFDMRITNPALTAQVMVAAMRAAFRQRPGAYTMLEVPVIDLLPEDRDAVVARLV